MTIFGNIKVSKRLTCCAAVFVLLSVCTHTTSIASQGTVSPVSTGSVYRKESNSYGSSGTLKVGQNDIAASSNDSYYRGYAVFDMRNFPTDADISKVRIRYDFDVSAGNDPDGTTFWVEIGPLTCSKASWDSYDSQDRWRREYTSFYSSAFKEGLSTWNDGDNDVYITLPSSTHSKIENRAGDYVVFHFRFTSQWNGTSWQGDAYHTQNQVPDWARIDYGWDIFDLPRSLTDDDWLGTFSDLRLTIDYTIPNPPSKARYPSPSNGATNQSINVDTSWSNGGGATSYNVYFGTDSTPDSSEYKGNTPDTTYNPGTLLEGKTYYWRIDAKNSDGTTTGDVWQFTTTLPPPPKVATPSISPNGGTYTGSGTVGLSCSTSGSTIRYTINGSTPTSSSTRYTGLISISSSCTVKARAFKSGYTDSNVASASFTINPIPWVSTPSISPDGGTFTGSTQVSLYCSTSGATIRYTTNGATPTSSSTLYTGSFTVSSSRTVKARGFKSGYTDSNVASASFVIGGGGGGGVTPQYLRYTEDFASGKPDGADGWEYYSGSNGRIAVVSGQLRMDAIVNGTNALNEAILHLDLDSLANVTLILDHVNSSDENSSLPASFTGHYNGDGIAFSADGTTWYKLTDLTSNFTAKSFDLDAAVQAAGINYTSDFQIKFQQYDNYSWDIDGRAFDNITVKDTLLGSNDWSVYGVGDFNNDGQDDILWRNATDGTVGIWDDGRDSGWTWLGSVPANWTVQGIGDFNNDGQDDILWRNASDGTVGIWDDGRSSGWTWLGGVPANWTVQGIGDFNNDGQDDILWRNATDGTVGIWDDGRSSGWTWLGAV